MKHVARLVVVVFCASFVSGGPLATFASQCSLTGVRACNLTAGDDPTRLLNGCPTCVCTVDASQMCLRGLPNPPPACTAGQDPSRDNRCCLSCTPSAAVCSDALLAACKAAYTTLPNCPVGAQPRFNNVTCCVDCRPPPVDCTDANFATCQAALRVCSYGEDPIAESTSCCGTCRRGEALCNSTQVGQCLAKRAVCAVNESAIQIPGECCASCRAGPPRCNPACSADQACLYGLNNQATCVRAQTVRLVVAWRSPSNALATCDGVRDYIAEIVTRFCERGNNVLRCNAVAPLLKTARDRACQVVPSSSALIVDMDVPVIANYNAADALSVLSAAVGDGSSLGSDATGAAVANRAVCSLPADQLRACANQEQPVLNRTSNCFSCRPSSGRFSAPQCTQTLLTACADKYASLAACAAGTDPVRDPATCCFNCRPAQQLQCTDAQTDLCRRRFATLRDCLLGESPVFNVSACCLTCKPTDAPRNQSNPTCSAADVDTCLLARPVCATNEQPMFNRNQSCCAHCRRPERQCTRADVLQCGRNLPTCQSGTVPQTIPTECCPTCKPAEPTCSPACSDRQRCVHNFTTGLASCQVPRIVRVVMQNVNASDPAVCRDMPSLTTDAIKQFCDNADNADRCDTARERLRNVVAQKCTALASDTVAIDVASFEPPTATPGAPSSSSAQFEGVVSEAVRYAIRNATDGIVSSALPQERVRIACSLLADQIPVCATGVTPKLDQTTNCLSCRPPAGQACSCATNPSSIRACAQGETPQRNAVTCCPSCLPQRNTSDADCASSALDACQAAVKTGTLAACAAGESPAFNRTTCCLSCAPTAPPTSERPATNGSCTRAQFATCLAKAPVCADDERPVIVSTQCCPSCRNPERGCAITDVARCVAASRTCQPGERPMHLDGDCCPSCTYRPACNCSTEQVCDVSNTTAVCRPLGVTLRAIFRRVNDTQALDCAAAVFAFKEAIRRVCDDINANASRCDIAKRVANSGSLLDCVRENDNTYVNMDLAAVPEVVTVATDVPSLVNQAFSSAQVADFSAMFNVVSDTRTCTLDPATIPDCAANEIPTLVRATKCYSCRVDNGRAGCSDAQVAACKASVPPPCIAGQSPARNASSCCPTCRLVQAVCSPQQQQLCQGNISGLLLPACDVGVSPTFNPTTCCVDCRRDPSQQEGGVTTGQRCSQAQFDSCLTNSPVCANGETPARVTGACCPSCKRPERQCSAADVIACRTSQRTCAAGELPASTGTDCCPTCIPARANCSTACNATQVCTQMADGSARCRFAGTLVRLALRKGADAVPACGQLVPLIQEIVNRYCDKNDNAAACDAVGVQDDVSGLTLQSCVRSGANNESADVVLAVPADTQSNIQRRSSSSSAALVTEASSDPSATSGMSVSSSEASSSSSSNTTPIIVGAVVGGVALVALVAFVAMRRGGRGTLATPAVSPAPTSHQDPIAVTSMY